MGIYRYQGQRNGKLKERAPQEKTARWTAAALSDQQSHPPSDRGIKCWWKRGRQMGAAVKNLSVIVTGGVLLVSAVTLFGAWQSGGRIIDQIYEAFTAPQPEPEIDMQPLLMQQLRGISELTTAVFAMQTVVPASRDRTLGGYVIGRTTLLYIAYGEVRAGIDLSAIQAEDIQVNGDSVTIQLPPPQILDSKVDVNRSKVYDYDRGFLGLGPDAAPELQDLAAQTTLQQIVEAACTQGVLQTASTQAQETISQLLVTAGYANSTVQVRQPAPGTCPTGATGATGVIGEPQGTDDSLALPEEGLPSPEPPIPSDL
ncbi:DUF4230 domain-containing protein [Egbenema bharatensis]|uniref:DUF4230 domain-containing protein n=1 Tax=Egbenema bharatensis TaxID=3463334 RepID=UPI003A8C4C2C